MTQSDRGLVAIALLAGGSLVDDITSSYKTMFA